MIQIRYFASLRETLGTALETLEPPPAIPETVGDLAVWLCRRGPPWSEALGEGGRFLAAVNQEMAVPGTPIRDGDEIAFFPPVTGG